MISLGDVNCGRVTTLHILCTRSQFTILLHEVSELVLWYEATGNIHIALR